MQDLSVMPLACGLHTRVSHSALPDSPVVPDRPPGRLRRLIGGALHRLAGNPAPTWHGMARHTG